MKEPVRLHCDIRLELIATQDNKMPCSEIEGQESKIWKKPCIIISSGDIKPTKGVIPELIWAVCTTYIVNSAQTPESYDNCSK